MPEITFIKLKDLPVYAASGLVKNKDNFYVISDDERSFFAFNLHSESFQKIELLPGDLPTNLQERKKLKPDWEALSYFPPQSGEEGILVVPSGSKPNRQTGFFLSLSDRGLKPIEIDFSKLYEKLQKNIAELNIEGALVMNSKLKLLQRGNGKSNQNAIIDLDLKKIFRNGRILQDLSSDCILEISFVDLGEIENAPLSFTDGFAMDGFLYFLAVGEETTSTYEDGPFKGAILGKMTTEGKILDTWKLNCPFKPEGLWMEKSQVGYQAFIVTDADSRTQVSSLYIGEIHGIESTYDEQKILSSL